MTAIDDLPPQNAHRSLALSNYIRKEMLLEKNQAMSFADFMELALYHPEWGYYNAENSDLGKHGDFTTSPEISPLFAKCLARQIQQISSACSFPSLLELGAGTGRLASDLLTELNSLRCLPSLYFIYEISPALRKKQQALLQSTHPRIYSRIIWLDTLPENFRGTIIANEVLDALPVHCFRMDENGPSEKYVAWENNQFIFKYLAAGKDLQKEALRIPEAYALPEGYEFEINFHLPPFIAALAASLNQGVILFSDYGYGEREYYHPERRSGSLSCFYQHKQYANPLIWPGLMDITAHVNFTRVIETAADHGLSLLGFTSQAAFLLSCGLTEFVLQEEKNLSETEKFALHHAVKILTLPTEMGDRIKFMALGKGVELPLIGFRMQDRRRDL